MSSILSSEFFARATPIVAQELVGCVLEHRNASDVTQSSSEFTKRVRITETEAYLHTGDDASHSRMGPTKRNTPMFGPPGVLYVYFIYGMHWCANIVTEPEGIGAAVLLRAGIDLSTSKLVNGPGRLTKFLGLNSDHNTLPVTHGVITIIEDEQTQTFRSNLVISHRIGISRSKELPLRFNSSTQN